MPIPTPANPRICLTSGVSRLGRGTPVAPPPHRRSGSDSADRTQEHRTRFRSRQGPLGGDYDGWVAQGCTRWGWDDVRPLFLRSEDHLAGADAHHATGGPLPV
ncbi:hypothetical protein, partial [Saccharopolyspora erythraea]